MKFACVQMNSVEAIQDNLVVAEKLIREAVSGGADIVCTPEVTDHMLADRSERLDECFFQEDHPAVHAFSSLAKELSVYLLIGSMIIKGHDNRLYNRSFLFAPSGDIQTTYDKMHLCDTDLPTGEQYRESSLYAAGDKAVVTQVNDITLGMSICRDLRYGKMYRALARQGASVIAVPAAWLATTGTLHWEVLLRARAIETGCYIIAPDQVGSHAGDRKTYGHSMIVNPWGEIVVQSDKPHEDVIFADIDLSLVAQARKAIPCLSHDQEYAF
ncbi:MAG: carbon-nitrogen hydrolase family protein [Bdellovibrionales bacterium]